MSQENFEQFRRQVFSDRSLQLELRELTDQETFVNRVRQLGEECGYSFTVEDIAEAMRANRRVWIERWF